MNSTRKRVTSTLDNGWTSLFNIFALYFFTLCVFFRLNFFIALKKWHTKEARRETRLFITIFKKQQNKQNKHSIRLSSNVTSLFVCLRGSHSFNFNYLIGSRKYVSLVCIVVQTFIQLINFIIIFSFFSSVCFYAHAVHTSMCQ